MADINQVHITGSEPGALKDALDGIPPWATQKTAAQIAKLLTKSVDIQGDLLDAIESFGKTGPGATGSQKKNQDALDKLFKTISKSNEEEAKRNKKRKDQDKEDEKSLFRGKKLQGITEKVLYVLGGLAKIGQKVLEVDKQYIKTSDELFQSGVNLLSGQTGAVESMESLNQIVNLTGIRLEGLQEVTQKYSASINAVGFTKFAKSLGLAQRNLAEVGYSSKQSAELLGAYTESAQGYSDLRRRSEKEFADDALRFGSMMTKLSLTVGISREQLLANNKAISKSSDVAIVAAKYGKQGAEKLSAFAASFPDQELGRQFTAMASDTVPALNATFQDLAKSGLGAFGNQLVEFSRRVPQLDPAQARKQLDQIMKNVSEQRLAELRLQAQAGNASAAKSLDLINNLYQASRPVSEATDKQTEAAIKSQAAIAKLQSATESAAATAQKIFYPLEAQLNIVTNSLELFNSAVKYGTDNISGTTRSWIGAGLIVAGFGATLLGVSKGLGTFTSLFSGAGTKLTGIVSNTAGAFGRFLPMLARGAGVIGAGIAGFEIGDKIINPLLNKASEAITGTKGETLGTALYGLLNGSDEEKISKMLHGDSTRISVPKSPAQTTIKSPSAVPAAPTTVADTSAPSAESPATPIGPGIEKPPKNSDINSMIAFQNALSEQMLLAMNKLVSVNSDILRYTRNQS